jgi:hypothetical protein
MVFINTKMNASCMDPLGIKCHEAWIILFDGLSSLLLNVLHFAQDVSRLGNMVNDDF